MMAHLTLAWQLIMPDLLPMYEESVARMVREHGEADSRTLDRIRDLAGFLIRNKRYAEAESWLRRTADLEPLGDVLAALRRPAEAAPIYEQCGSADCIAKLAAMLEGPQALPLYRKALAMEEKSGGAKLAVRLNDVALLSREEPLFRRALAIQEKTHGPRHPEVATTLNNLASLLLESNRAPEAEPLARRALTILEATLGKRNVRTAVSASNLADIRRALGKPARALYQQAFDVFQESLGPDHPWTKEALAASRAQ